MALLEESSDYKQPRISLRRRERTIGFFPAAGTGTMREEKKEKEWKVDNPYDVEDTASRKHTNRQSLSVSRIPQCWRNSGTGTKEMAATVQ